MPSEDSSSDPCKCGHVRGSHVSGCEECHAAGLDTLSHHAFLGPKPQLRCTCGHLRRSHVEDKHRCIVTRNGTCGCQVFVCDHSACGWKPRRDFVSPEPPLTPEEEEAFLIRCDHCGAVGHSFEDCPEGEVPGWAACSPELLASGVDCDTAPRCPGSGDVSHYHPEPPPPQPERRPPYAVAYSVGGHLYEVALPGDAMAQAVDGALIIKHALGPVAGIVQVLPIETKEAS